MDDKRCLELLDKALKQLPEEFKDAIKNRTLLIEDAKSEG